MARKPRKKLMNAIYHIISKSIPEINMFDKKEDIEKYLYILNKYKNIYDFKVYGYCFMNNHVHLMIDTLGADIAKIMHDINFSYAMYYNKKHKRSGTLFKDRYKSKIIKNLLNLKFVSLYIHNNPKCLKKFKNRLCEYNYSSLGIYMGNKKDTYNIIDSLYVLGFFGEGIRSARKNYYRMLTRKNLKLSDVTTSEDKGHKEIGDTRRKMIPRNISIDIIKEFIKRKFDLQVERIMSDYNITKRSTKAFLVILFKRYCSMSNVEISSIFNCLGETKVSGLCDLGSKIIGERFYWQLLDEFKSFLKSKNNVKLEGGIN